MRLTYAPLGAHCLGHLEKGTTAFCGGDALAPTPLSANAVADANHLWQRTAEIRRCISDRGRSKKIEVLLRLGGSAESIHRGAPHSADQERDIFADSINVTDDSIRVAMTDQRVATCVHRDLIHLVAKQTSRVGKSSRLRGN